MEKNLKKNIHIQTHTHTYITESLWHTPETNPTLFLNSEKKKKNPQDSVSLHRSY